MPVLLGLLQLLSCWLPPLPPLLLLRLLLPLDWVEPCRQLPTLQLAPLLGLLQLLSCWLSFLPWLLLLLLLLLLLAAGGERRVP